MHGQPWMPALEVADLVRQAFVRSLYACALAEDRVTQPPGDERSHEFVACGAESNPRLQVGFGEDREKVLTAGRQVEQDQRFVDEFVQRIAFRVVSGWSGESNTYGALVTSGSAASSRSPAK